MSNAVCSGLSQAKIDQNRPKSTRWGQHAGNTFQSNWTDLPRLHFYVGHGQKLSSQFFWRFKSRNLRMNGFFTSRWVDRIISLILTWSGSFQDVDWKLDWLGGYRLWRFSPLEFVYLSKILFFIIFFLCTIFIFRINRFILRSFMCQLGNSLAYLQRTIICGLTGRQKQGTKA
jgi:hypothetical protein